MSMEFIITLVLLILIAVIGLITGDPYKPKSIEEKRRQFIG